MTEVKLPNIEDCFVGVSGTASACEVECVRDNVGVSGSFSLVNFEEDLERVHQWVDVGECKYGEFIDTLEWGGRKSLKRAENYTDRMSETN